MAKVRLKWNNGAFAEIRTCDAALALVDAKAKAITEACNAESSWGGYASSATNGLEGTTVDKNGRRRGAGGRFVSRGLRARATVWSFDNRVDEARDNRMIRNLDA
jgi:hypothetical protein